MRTREDRARVSAQAKMLEQIDVTNTDKAIEYVNMIVKANPFSYFSILTGHRFAKIWNVILEKTKFLDEHFKPNVATRIYYFIHRMDHIHVCETCGKPYVKQLKAGNLPPEFFHCSNRCAQVNPRVLEHVKATKTENGTTTRDLLERTKQRNREKYGVDWYMQTDQYKRKTAETWKSHGYDHPMHNAEIKQAMQERLSAKYGEDVKWSFQIPSVKEKIIEHNRATYGTDWPMQNNEMWQLMHDNSAKTNRRKFYNRFLVSLPDFEILTSEDEYANMDKIVPQGMTYPRTLLKWRCKKCGYEFEQFLWLYGKNPRCLKCDPLLYMKSASQVEIDVFNFMSAVSGSKYECVRNSFYNWSILGDMQLDIVCLNTVTHEPEIAVEFNGVYWHSVDMKLAGYHLDKTKACERLGIKLIHIWEDDWLNNNADVKQFLTDVLIGKTPIDFSDNVIELDRSKFCKLWIPDGFTIEEIAPTKQLRFDGKEQRRLVEDCGKLIAYKK